MKKVIITTWLDVKDYKFNNSRVTISKKEYEGEVLNRIVFTRLIILSPEAKSRYKNTYDEEGKITTDKSISMRSHSKYCVMKTLMYLSDEAIFCLSDFLFNSNELQVKS